VMPTALATTTTTIITIPTSLMCITRLMNIITMTIITTRRERRASTWSMCASLLANPLGAK
jgi:hypothetical protein